MAGGQTDADPLVQGRVPASGLRPHDAGEQRLRLVRACLPRTSRLERRRYAGGFRNHRRRGRDVCQQPPRRRAWKSPRWLRLAEGPPVQDFGRTSGGRRQPPGRPRLEPVGAWRHGGAARAEGRPRPGGRGMGSRLPAIGRPAARRLEHAPADGGSRGPLPGQRKRGMEKVRRDMGLRMAGREPLRGVPPARRPPRRGRAAPAL